MESSGANNDLHLHSPVSSASPATFHPFCLRRSSAPAIWREIYSKGLHLGPKTNWIFKIWHKCPRLKESRHWILHARILFAAPSASTGCFYWPLSKLNFISTDRLPEKPVICYLKSRFFSLPNMDHKESVAEKNSVPFETHSHIETCIMAPSYSSHIGSG